MTANAAKANPAAACTATATGGGASGGSLYVGTTATFFISYTNCDAFGETTPGSSELASALTVASTNIPQVTLPALPGGVDSRNIYVTAANGASGTEKLYATGVTTLTFNLSYAALADSPRNTYPTINTTGADVNYRRISRFFTVPSNPIENSTEELSMYLSGQSVREVRDIFTALASNQAAYLFWNQAWSEINTLVQANLPTYSWGSMRGNPDMKQLLATMP